MDSKKMKEKGYVSRKKCPHCKVEVNAAAKQCKDCNKKIEKKKIKPKQNVSNNPSRTKSQIKRRIDDLHRLDKQDVLVIYHWETPKRRYLRFESSDGDMAKVVAKNGTLSHLRRVFLHLIDEARKERTPGEKEQQEDKKGEDQEEDDEERVDDEEEDDEEEEDEEEEKEEDVPMVDVEITYRNDDDDDDDFGRAAFPIESF
eukprot:TCONS_00016049-protein